MPTTSNFGWTTPADTDLVKDGAAAIRTLGNGIDTSFLDLKGGTSGQILSKNSNTDLDFVWIANDQGDITAVTAGTGISGGGTSGAVTITNSMATEITAKGDLIVGTGNAAFDNLPAGTNGHVLTADSTVSPTGLKWAAPAAGGKVLQVVSAVYSTSTVVNTTSYADTGLSATITPTLNTSKILVLISQTIRTSGSATVTGGAVKVLRGATDIYTVAGTNNQAFLIGETAVNTYKGGSYAFNYLDSPATTSATTYKTQGRRNANAASEMTFNADGASSSITLLEIGA